MKCGIKSGPGPLTVFVSSLWIPKKFQPFQNCNKCGKVLHFNWNHILYYSSIVNCFNDYTYTYTAFSIWWHVDGSYPSESGTNSLLRIHRKCFEHFLMSLIFCFWHADCFLFTVAFFNFFKPRKSSPSSSPSFWSTPALLSGSHLHFTADDLPTQITKCYP